jgi:hypothetical protein
MSTAEFHLSIQTPGDWIVLDADALGDSDRVDALVGDRLDAVPELADRRDDLVATVARTLKRARQDGVVFTAILGDVGADGQVLMANLAVGTSAAPPVDEDAVVHEAEGSDATDGARATRPPDLDALLAADEPEVDRRAVDSILMPAGPAIRVARLFDVPLTDDGPMLSVLSVQYFFSIPDADQMVVLSFSTPSVGAAEHLQRIFHGIAETVDFGG